jgi:hypothetical protein
MANVVRGNHLDNHARIKVTDPVKDLIIEHNVVQNTEQGLTVIALPSLPAGAHYRTEYFRPRTDT